VDIGTEQGPDPETDTTVEDFKEYEEKKRFSICKRIKTIILDFLLLLSPFINYFVIYRSSLSLLLAKSPLYIFDGNS